MLVSPDRYLAGRLAEHHFGATVHVLDDGFQHLQLDRDVDIVIVGRDDVAHPVTLPRGRLREPLDTLIAADAVVTADDEVDRCDGLGASRRGLRRAARPREAGGRDARRDRCWPWPASRRRSGSSTICARRLDARGDAARFAITIRYSRRDVRRIFDAARAAGAGAVLTTEKDFVRLLPFRPFPMPVGWVPLTMEPEPLPEFRRWLAGSLAAARDIIVG